MKKQLWFAVVVLLLALVGLQYRLWWGQNSLSELAVLKQKIAEQETENQRMRDKNAALMQRVEDLRSGDDELEARARKDLGMIKQGETFFLYFPPEASASSAAQPSSDVPSDR